MSTQSSFSRRNFIKSSAVAAGATTLAAKQHANAQGTNEQLQIGMIGCGGMAGAHLRSLISMKKDKNIAIRWCCDVMLSRAENFQQQVVGAGREAKRLKTIMTCWLILT